MVQVAFTCPGVARVSPCRPAGEVGLELTDGFDRGSRTLFVAQFVDVHGPGCREGCIPLGDSTLGCLDGGAGIAGTRWAVQICHWASDRMTPL